MKKKLHKHSKIIHIVLFIVLGAVFVSGFVYLYFTGPKLLATTYESSDITSTSTPVIEEDITEIKKDTFIRIHIDTPDAVKAIYMSQCVVGTPSFRADLVEVAETTEINSIIIDVKDYTGKLAFRTDHPDLISSVSNKCGATDMREFIKMLNEKGIYTIARITVFQDPYYTQTYPEFAVKKASATSTLWVDYKGLSFIDVGARPFWDYIIAISKEAYDIGFDELNFDYIRFPSDGNMRDIYYPFSDQVVSRNPSTGKAEVVETFFAYLAGALRGYSTESVAQSGEYYNNSHPVLSADLFGMTTTNTDDLNIGQVLERATPYFDFIAPMVYPSHYPRGFNGWDNPNNYVYEIVKYSMDRAVLRMQATTTKVKTLSNISVSTTTNLYSNQLYSKLKLRPWLQDFDYGGNYGPVEVRAQIQAVYDSGLTSWMLWAPSNRYTLDALEKTE